VYIYIYYNLAALVFRIGSSHKNTGRPPDFSSPYFFIRRFLSTYPRTRTHARTHIYAYFCIIPKTPSCTRRVARGLCYIISFHPFSNRVRADYAHRRRVFVSGFLRNREPIHFSAHTLCPSHKDVPFSEPNPRLASVYTHRVVGFRTGGRDEGIFPLAVKNGRHLPLATRGASP